MDTAISGPAPDTATSGTDTTICGAAPVTRITRAFPHPSSSSSSSPTGSKTRGMSGRRSRPLIGVGDSIASAGTVGERDLDQDHERNHGCSGGGGGVRNGSWVRRRCSRACTGCHGGGSRVGEAGAGEGKRCRDGGGASSRLRSIAGYRGEDACQPPAADTWLDVSGVRGVSAGDAGAIMVRAGTALPSGATTLGTAPCSR